MLAAGSSMKKIVNFKAQLARKFSTKDLGLVKTIRGMRISRERKKNV